MNARRILTLAVRVMRQVHYSKHNANSIDLVFFVNGIPVATPPGAIALTRIPRRASPTAISRLIASTPPLLAV